VKEREAKSWAKAGAYTGLAFILPIAMLVCYYLGDWADRKLGTRFLYLVGIMLGFAAGLWETIRQADQIENGIRTGKDNSGKNKR
jgi:F0F1-type ATP synthase assembly protein I